MNTGHAELLLKSAANPRLARPEDAGVLSRLFSAAFLNDPVFDFFVRQGSQRQAAFEIFFYRLLSQRDIPQGEVWMADNGVACTIWLAPGALRSPSGLLERLRLIPFLVNVCGFSGLGRVSALMDAMEKNHPLERHFYLPFMAVDPRYQGMGLGAAILDATLRRIDGMGEAAYLENSSPRNTRLYERAGFIAQKDIAPKGCAPLVAMLRPAAKP
jgi:ribosomal protein S18 acetylase RimI-like enzyme